MFILDWLNALGYASVVMYGLHFIFFSPEHNRRGIIEFHLRGVQIQVNLYTVAVVFVTMSSLMLCYPEISRGLQYFDGTLEFNQRFSFIELLYTTADFCNIFAFLLIIDLAKGREKQ